MLSKLFRIIFPKDIPIWFHIINLVILVPCLLWPFVFFLTLFLFDKTDDINHTYYIFILINSYPIYLIFLVFINLRLFKINKFIGLILPTIAFISLFIGIGYYYYLQNNKMQELKEKTILAIENGVYNDTDNKNIKIKNHLVYLNDSIVEGADTATFEVISWDWQRDKKYYYRFGKKIEGIDRTTFQLLDYGYAKDKKYVYYEGKILKGADAPSFFHIEGTQDARDNNNCYRWGEIVACEVIETDQ